MSAIPAPVPYPDDVWDIARAAVSFPGDTVSKKYSPWRPNSFQSGALWSTLNQLTWQVGSAQTFWKLAEAYITMSFQLVDTGNANAPYAAGTAIAPVYAPSFFNGGSFRIGGVQLEQLNANTQQTTFVRQHLRRSGAQRVYGGYTINMAVQPPATQALITSPTVYPPSNAGVNSTNLNPVLVSTVASSSPALNNNIFSTAYVNPDFSAFFYQSQRLTDAGKIWTVKVPLVDILSCLNSATPVVQGQVIDLELLCGPINSIIFSAPGVNQSNLILKDCLLWLPALTPSVEISARIAEMQAAGQQSQIQSVIAATLPFPVGAQQGFSQSTTLQVANPQWLIFTFRPQSAATTQSACMPQCSIPPYAYNNSAGAFPFSTFQITLNDQVIPEPQFGTYPTLDMQRAYELYLECCEATDLMGGGPPVSLEQYTTNFFFLCIPAYNRKPEVAAKGIAAGSSVNINCTLQGNPSAAWNMYMTYTGIQTSVFSATGSGISVINVS